MLLGALLAGSIFVSTAQALEPQQGSAESARTPASRQAPTGTAPAVSSPVRPHRQRKLASPYRSKGTSIHEQQFYQINWGVDSFSAKTVEAGQMIRFSYRVVDAQKATALNDKKAAPSLIDERAHVQLVVPSMEKVGQLRGEDLLDDVLEQRDVCEARRPGERRHRKVSCRWISCGLAP